MGWIGKLLTGASTAHKTGPPDVPAPVTPPSKAAGTAPKKGESWQAALMRHFDLSDVLGYGGYSTVYRARRLADGREYALKVTDLDRLPPWSQQAAVREARVLSALGGGGGSAAEAAPRGTAGAPHPCLATYRESFCLGSRLCIVTEVAQGGDLKRLLEQRAAAGAGGLGEHEVWRILLQVVLALQRLHSHRVLHRDVKPHNVLLCSGGVAQLTDLGVCGQLGSVFTRKEAGTPQYKAPEMWRVGQPYSFSSDMWALGAVLFEMCTARPLFDGPPGCTDPQAAVAAVQQQVLSLSSPPPLPAGYSPELVGVVAALLRPSPADRPTAAELLALPAVAARLHLLPAAVQAQLPQPDSEQQGHPCGRGCSACSPIHLLAFHEQAVNACLPAAAYPCGSSGLLASLDSQQQQQQQQQRSRGRFLWPGRGRRTTPEPTASSASSAGRDVSAAASSSSRGSVRSGTASLASLDLAALHSPRDSMESPRSASCSAWFGACSAAGALSATALV